MQDEGILQEYDCDCPACGKHIDALYSVMGGKPEAGSLLICADCYAVLEFQADLKLKALTEADLIFIDTSRRSNGVFLNEIKGIIADMKELKALNEKERRFQQHMKQRRNN